MIRSLIKDDMDYVREGNVFHFVTDEAARPAWSKALDEYLTGTPVNLMMKRRMIPNITQQAHLKYLNLLLPRY